MNDEQFLRIPMLLLRDELPSPFKSLSQVSYFWTDLCWARRLQHDMLRDPEHVRRVIKRLFEMAEEVGYLKEEVRLRETENAGCRKMFSDTRHRMIEALGVPDKGMSWNQLESHCRELALDLKALRGEFPP